MGRNESLNDSPTLMAMDKAYVENDGWPIAGLVFLLTIAVLFLSLAFRSDAPAAF